MFYHVETIVCTIYLKIDIKYFHKNSEDGNWTLSLRTLILEIVSQPEVPKGIIDYYLYDVISSSIGSSYL